VIFFTTGMAFWLTALVDESYNGQMPTNPPVKSAVILAAGESSRLHKEKGKEISKPLLKVGGLHLIERCVLTLHECGIRRFFIVVGHMRESLIKTVRGLKSLAKMDIQFVECENFEKGNGVSLAAGAKSSEEPFLVAMADHVMLVDTIREFIKKIDENPEKPQLATDPDVGHVFDVDDATKLKSEEGKIVALDKKLAHFNGIDMGLFYFPKGFGEKIQAQVDAGANTVTDMVNGIIQKEDFLSVPLKDAVWQDVDTLKMAREAEKRILKALVKSNDGPVSRYFNRPLSRFISRYLAKWGIKPNAITTVVTFITLIASAMVASSGYHWLVLGGIIFQLASVLDGCDGEVARISFRSTRFGALYDVLSDNLRYAVFFSCLGVGVFRLSGQEIYFWAVVLFVLLFIFFSTYKARFGFKSPDSSAYLRVPATVVAWSRNSDALWDRLILPLRVIIKQDVIAVIVLTLCLANLASVLFWMALIAMLLISISVVRALEKEKAANGERLSNPIIFFFFLVGLGILGFLIKRMPFGEVMEALYSVGFNVLWVFAVAPLWFFANTMALSSLIQHRVGFFNLLYNQMVGEAMNTVVPLAGIGGEPFKVKHLSRWLPIGEASQAIILDRLVHAVSGLFYSALLLFATVYLVSFSANLEFSMILVGILLVALGILLTIFSLSGVPGRVTSFILKRFSTFEVLRQKKLPKGTFAACLGYKLLGRVISLIEIYLILRFLGIAITPGIMAIVAAFIAASSLLINVIPQGLGVAEAGITGAFSLIGLAPHLGLTFGLIRRARIIFWALVGISIFLPFQLVRSLVRPADIRIK
jgi:CDP-L-myo-inositol myo-inositolphosphotransferase